MDTKQLRLGNYVYEIDRRGEVHLEVVRIDQGAILTCTPRADKTKAYQKHIHKSRDIVGIPLTGKWLLEFGFKSNPLVLYEKEGFCVDCGHVTENQAVLSFMFGDLYGEIYFVHELQNLYYSVTGKELIWKPNNDQNNE